MKTEVTIEADAADAAEGLMEFVTCPTCGMQNDLDDCIAYDEADWPEDNPGLFPGTVLQLDCGHDVHLEDAPDVKVVSHPVELSDIRCVMPPAEDLPFYFGREHNPKQTEAAIEIARKRIAGAA